MGGPRAPNDRNKRMPYGYGRGAVCPERNDRRGPRWRGETRRDKTWLRGFRRGLSDREGCRVRPTPWWLSVPGSLLFYGR